LAPTWVVLKTDGASAVTRIVSSTVLTCSVASTRDTPPSGTVIFCSTVDMPVSCTLTV
jgi:hypothetical protein